MKSMKSILKRKPRDVSEQEDVVSADPEIQLDTPEANAARGVRLFCQSGGPQNSGDEVLYLPTIVEAAESSPSAAKDCALAIRKYLGKEFYKTPNVQYNAIMLIRILADNPGKTFTRNFDKPFVQTMKELLRTGRDPSVKQILLECLDAFSREKASDPGLAGLIEMWKKEHEKISKIHNVPATLNAPPQQDAHSQNYFSRTHRSHRLPPPTELASRIEEAQTSAKLLIQVVQSTPPSEFLNNELIREFADRCASANKSIVAYMSAENPAPDNSTMETLIETSELLQKAMTAHQRASLAAKKTMGINGGASVYGQGQSSGPRQYPAAVSNPAVDEWRRNVEPGPPVPPPGDFALTNVSDDDVDENPFSDPKHDEERVANMPFPSDKPSGAPGQFNDSIGVEPFHPGFRASQAFPDEHNVHQAIPGDADSAVSDEVYQPPTRPPPRQVQAQAAAPGPKTMSNMYRY